MTFLNGDTLIYSSYAKKYSNNFEQAASLVNECSGDHSSDIICVNNNPQTEGKSNNVNTPINSQITNPHEVLNKELQVRQVQSKSIIVPSGEREQVRAECDADEVVVGGGSSVTGFAGGPILPNELKIDSADSKDGNGWLLDAFNNGPNPIAIQVFADCAQLVDVP